MAFLWEVENKKKIVTESLGYYLCDSKCNPLPLQNWKKKKILKKKQIKA